MFFVFQKSETLASKLLFQYKVGESTYCDYKVTT